MCTTSGRGENTESSDRVMCSDTQGEFIRVQEVVSGKINVKMEEWLRDVEKRKKRKTTRVYSGT